MDVLKPLKIAYLVFLRIKYRRANVRIGRGVYINRHSKFEKNIRIGNSSWVSGSIIGRNTYLDYNVRLPYCIIGRFCSIAQNVEVVMATHPTRKFVSTSPVFYSSSGKQCGFTFVDNNLFEEHLSIDGKSVIIGNDVWIGQDVKIVAGVRIGDGAIIAMGAIVTKDVEPYSIVGGVPAKIIRKRFSEEQIEQLLKFQWWNKTDEWLSNNVDSFKDIDSFTELINRDC